MTVWIARVSLVLALALAVALGVQTIRISRMAEAELHARAAVQSEQLVAAGWQRASEASQAELARIVPPLRAEIEALRAANARLAAASHWTGHGAPVAVPCIPDSRTRPDNMAPPAGDTDAAPPGPPPPTGLPGEPLTVGVTPHVRVNSVLALADDGSAFAVQKVQARLTSGLWASEWAEVTPDEESGVIVDERVSAAWKAYNAPRDVFAVLPRDVKRWRVGWFAGPAITVDPTGQVGLGLAVGWGAQF